MAAIRGRPLNPELESLRCSGLKTSTDNQSKVTDLIEATKRVHSAWLFDRPIGTPALQALCKSLGVTYTHQEGNWKDFCGALGMKDEEIRCIDNINGIIDRVELALKTYSQDENSSISSIIRALDSMKRYDVVNKVFPHMIKLSAIVHEIQRNGENEAESDSGYCSTENSLTSGYSIPTQPQIVKPKLYTYLTRELPLSLQKLQWCRAVERTQTTTRTVTESLQTAVRSGQTPQQLNQQANPNNPQNKAAWKKSVFLTFAADGEEIAYRVANALRHPANNNRSPVGVLILDENWEKLSANTEGTIVKLFNQVNYIMPIVTKGYLDAIQFEPPPYQPTDTLSSMDARYAFFIHDLMRKYYVTNNCWNDKFRCVLPNCESKSDDNKSQSSVKELLSDPTFQQNPTLKVWIYEKDIEKLMCRLHGIYN